MKKSAHSTETLVAVKSSMLGTLAAPKGKRGEKEYELRESKAVSASSRKYPQCYFNWSLYRLMGFIYLFFNVSMLLSLPPL